MVLQGKVFVDEVVSSLVLNPISFCMSLNEFLSLLFRTLFRKCNILVLVDELVADLEIT